jgi:glycosidase
VLASPRLRFAPIWLALACGSATCGSEPPPSVDCRQVVWVKPSRASSEVRVIGSWDGWQAEGVLAEDADDGWKAAVLELPAGEHAYQIVIDGKARLDPSQPLTTYHGEEEVSLLLAPDCQQPAIAIDSASAPQGALSIAGRFLAKHGGPAVDASSLSVSIDGARAPSATIHATPETGAFTVEASGLARGKHAIRIDAADEGGLAAQTARASVWVEPAAETWADAVLYQVVIDRFRGEGGSDLAPPPTPGTRAGGTLSGVTAEIERGTFEALGVTALWLSPVYTNPEAFETGRDGHLSQGYHGYWPLADREVDPAIGGEAALDALIAAAHAHGLRVLFDLVPNHVHDKNPRYAKHAPDGWFDDGPDHCVCGDPGCDWAKHIERCWFTPFLPDVRWQSGDAMRAAVDDTIFWMDRFDADGVRIDAVPMMPRSATRRILRGMRDRIAPRDALFAVGEVFTGPGGADVIKYYMGPHGLDSAFDFPLMWAMRDAIAAGHSGLDAIERTIADGEDALRGSGAVIARMLGNHDTTRFASESNGDAGQNAWSSPPPQPSASFVYARQRVALALVHALPGMPVIYYGDEVGLAGASDPDCRRVMPSASSLSPDQQETLAFTKTLGALRRCSNALRRGERTPIWADGDTLAFARDAGDGSPVVALFSTSVSDTTIPIPGGVVPDGDYVDALTGEAFSLQGSSEIPMSPLTARFLLPAHSPSCFKAP